MPKSPIGLWAGIHLGKKLHMYVGKGPRAGQVWKTIPDNWPRVNKDLIELSYNKLLTQLFTVLLFITGTPAPLPSWCVSLPCSVLTAQIVCSPTCYVVSLRIDFVFTVFATLKNAVFMEGKGRGTLLLSSSPQWTSS